MVQIGRRDVHLANGWSRRDLLKRGALALCGLSLPEVLRLRAAQATHRGIAVILYWMSGGPSQIDTYDPKPAAPAEVRGPFRSIATRVPGMSVCELLPRHARLADKFTLIRSLAHNNADHFDASHWVQTGYHEFKVMGRGQPHPSQGSVVSHLRGGNRPGMPPYVCIPDAYSPNLSFYQQAGFLSAEHNPLSAGGEPAYRGKRRRPEFALSGDLTMPRVASRRDLLRRFDHLARQADRSKACRSLDASRQRAFELITSPGVKRAFDLSREPAPLHERYGRHPWGQAALLARRLVENGVTFVTINHYEADIDWWDDHYTIEKNLRKRLPPFDQALAALIGDIHERGLAKQVLVVACGEFGRSPRIDNLAGRGHWPRAMSALVSGGGLAEGRIIGSTNADGGTPRDRPLGPGDLLATIYRALGIDANQTLPDHQGRPVRLVETGEAIKELF
jgi:hypothetical protein